MINSTLFSFARKRKLLVLTVLQMKVLFFGCGGILTAAAVPVVVAGIGFLLVMDMVGGTLNRDANPIPLPQPPQPQVVVVEADPQLLATLPNPLNDAQVTSLVNALSLLDSELENAPSAGSVTVSSSGEIIVNPPDQQQNQKHVEGSDFEVGGEQISIKAPLLQEQAAPDTVALRAQAATSGEDPKAQLRISPPYTRTTFSEMRTGVIRLAGGTNLPSTAVKFHAYISSLTALTWKRPALAAFYINSVIMEGPNAGKRYGTLVIVEAGAPKSLRVTTFYLDKMLNAILYGGSSAQSKQGNDIVEKTVACDDASLKYIGQDEGNRNRFNAIKLHCNS